MTKADIALANAIAHEVLGRTLDELPPQTRRLLNLIARDGGERRRRTSGIKPARACASRARRCARPRSGATPSCKRALGAPGRDGVPAGARRQSRPQLCATSCCTTASGDGHAHLCGLIDRGRTGCRQARLRRAQVGGDEVRSRGQVGPKSAPGRGQVGGRQTRASRAMLAMAADIGSTCAPNAHLMAERRFGPVVPGNS